MDFICPAVGPHSLGRHFGASAKNNHQKVIAILAMMSATVISRRYECLASDDDNNQKN
jgi:hypothetical protein